MFTLDQIKEAHSKVKSGTDFPGYVQELIKLGVVNYDTYVIDGPTEYNGENGYAIHSDAKYPSKDIAAKSNSGRFRHYLKIHQQGQTDYLDFCTHSAGTGVEKWTVDLNAMTCIYFDKAGQPMLIEEIPGQN
jgi:uncharacterized protein YbcV (DUF1398 family)